MMVPGGAGTRWRSPSLEALLAGNGCGAQFLHKIRCDQASTLVTSRTQEMWTSCGSSQETWGQF